MPAGPLLLHLLKVVSPPVQKLTPRKGVNFQPALTGRNAGNMIVLQLPDSSQPVGPCMRPGETE
jgi:hypothetical protein